MTAEQSSVGVSDLIADNKSNQQMREKINNQNEDTNQKEKNNINRFR